MIKIEDFKQMELRVGEILQAAPHPQADRLLVLKVRVGETEKTIVAGIRAHYQDSQLVGKKVIVVANLEPATIRGVVSEGMLLAASSESLLTLIIPERDIASGSKVS